jgi:hypothetical protein
VQNRVADTDFADIVKACCSEEQLDITFSPTEGMSDSCGVPSDALGVFASVVVAVFRSDS